MADDFPAITRHIDTDTSRVWASCQLEIDSEPCTWKSSVFDLDHLLRDGSTPDDDILTEEVMRHAMDCHGKELDRFVSTAEMELGGSDDTAT